MRLLQIIQIITKFFYGLILFIIILTFNSCFIPVKLSHANKKEITKVIYDNYFEFPSDAKISLEEYQDTLMTNFMKKYNLTFSDDEKKILRLLDTLKVTPKSEIHVEFSKDTIWRYKTYDRKTKFELARLNLENGIYYLQKRERNRFEEVVMNFFEGDSTYRVQEFPDVKEQILGFTCHKIIIEGCTMSIEKFPFSIGNSVFEMYVTDEIDIPLHAIVPMNKKFENYSPLKIRIWGECDGIVKVIQIKEILYN